MGDILQGSYHLNGERRKRTRRKEETIYTEVGRKGINLDERTRRNWFEMVYPCHLLSSPFCLGLPFSLYLFRSSLEVIVVLRLGNLSFHFVSFYISKGVPVSLYITVERRD